MNKEVRQETPKNAEREDQNAIRDWKLEFYLRGGLSAEERASIAALEREDECLRARLDALRASDAEILRQYPPAYMAAKTPVRAAREPSHSWNGNVFSRWAIPAFVCAAALICLPMRLLSPAFITDTAHNPADARESDGIRIKGSMPVLEVWRGVSGGVEKLAPDATAREGDIIQLRYAVPESCYGALFSVDGRGVLTVHLSDDSGKAAALTPGKLITLNHSYQLDDAPRFETFYFITAPGSFDINAVSEPLKNAEYPSDAKRLSEKRHITKFTLRKMEDGLRAGI